MRISSLAQAILPPANTARRARVGCALALALLLAEAAHGVELGQLTTESRIDQPLSARIELLDVGTTALEDISIRVASVEDFARLGVVRAANLESLDLSIQLIDGQPQLILATTQPVAAAYLDLVLDARWPSGRVLSQHTLLLDPPVFMEEAALVDAPAESPRQASVLTDRSSTLYSIALAARPEEGVTVQQTMLAIQRLNPGAFAGDNINGLYAGVILRLPSLEQVQELNPEQALAVVREQNQASERARASVVATSSSTAQASAAVSDQLSVVVPSPAAPAGAETDSLDRRIAQLESQLAVSQEELARVARERDEFLARLAAIESQITSAQEIIRLQDAQFAELTRSLAAAAEARSSAPARAAVESDPWARLGNPLVTLLALVTAVFAIVLLLLRTGSRAVEEESSETAIDLGAQPPGKARKGGSDELSAASLDAELAAIKGAARIEGEPAPASEPVLSEPAFDPDELEFGAQRAQVASSGQAEVSTVDDEEVSTKLELAYAYHKMGDAAGAGEILTEVIAEGNASQRAEAERLLETVNAAQAASS